MSFESITLKTQDKYGLKDAMRVKSCELEEWDSAEKLCYDLCENTPFIGEYVLSDHQFDDIIADGKKLFRQLVSHGIESLSKLEQKQLTCAAVYLTQRMDTRDSSEDDSQVWRYILSSLGYQEMPSSPSWQSCYKKMTELIRSNVPYFAEYGQKYYNTLRIQALAPEDSISELFEIIYSFYKNNLESQYDPSDSVFEILTKNIQKRLGNGDSRDDTRISFSSGFWTLKSSLKYLLSNEPEYMAAVCDAIASKMDALVRGDTPALCENNRWDVLLQKWFSSKSVAEMQSVRIKRVNAKVASKKEQIQPRYRLENDDVFIWLPGIRLPEITQRPVLKLFQNGELIGESKLSIYGDEMCYTTREYSLSLVNEDRLSWKAPLNFQLRIYCGDTMIYDSRAELFRKYFIFNSLGFESGIERCANGKIRLLTNQRSGVEIDDPEDQYSDLSHGDTFQLFDISLITAKRIVVDGVDILSNASNRSAFRCYFTPAPIDGISLSHNGNECLAFGQSPVLHVVLDAKDAAQNYQLQIEKATPRSLYEFYDARTDSIEIPLSGAARFSHSVKIKEFQTGKVMEEYHYMVIPKFSLHFSDPFFLNRAGETGSVKVSISGSTIQQDFSLLENQTELEVSLWDPSLRCKVIIPKINITINGENAFYWPKQVWHNAIPQTSFMQIEVPENVSVDPWLGSSRLQRLKSKRAFDLGNQLATTSTLDASLPLGVLIRCDGKGTQEKLTDIYFQPTFLTSPITREDSILTWEPSGKYIGDDDSEFQIQLENDESQEPWTYRETMKRDVMERNFNCAPGEYDCRVYLNEAGQGSPFQKKREPRLLWNTTYEITAKPEERFLGKRLYLTAARFWSPETTHDEIASIAQNDAIVLDIRYDGMDDCDGEVAQAEHFYTGILAFKTYAGRLIYMNQRPSRDYERINPIRFCVESDHLLVFNADGEKLQLNAKRFSSNRRVRILNRKELSLTPEQSRKWLPIADSFEYREEYDT